MDILNLKEELCHLEQLAEWHHNEWSYLNPGEGVEDRIAKMRKYLDQSFIPSTYIGKFQGELIGSAAIVKHDMDNHKELSPWLASVYVAKQFRKNGFGSRLVKHVMSKAKEKGFKKLYLFTPSQEQFYSNLGWGVVSSEYFRGSLVTIMKVDL